jgi:hypothetical protein
VAESVYKIGVEVALAGTIIQGLEAISARLLGINAKVGEIEGGFKRWGLAISGAAMVFTGGAMAEGMKKVVEQGGELVKQQALLRAMGGMSASDITGATASAQLATQKVIGTTISENLKGIRELVGVMPNLQEAEMAYPAVMQAAKVLESLGGGKADDSLQILAKAIELRGGGMNPVTGQLDPKRFVDEANAAQAAIMASGGLVNASSLLQYMKTAGPMARMMSDPDQFYRTALTAIMDMGGFRAGTAMTAVGRQLLGGKMAKPTAEEMQRLGVLQEGKWHASGTGVFVDKGGLNGEDILKDPKRGVLEWANKILLPALAAKGITASADIQQELYRVFGAETSRRMMGLFSQNQAQIQKDASLYDNARSAGSAYGNVAVGDLGQNVTNVKDAVANFLQAFGAPVVPMAIETLQKLSSGINSLAQGALAHPDAMKLIGEGLIGLSAALVLIGGAAVIGAMAMMVPGGLVAVGIAGLVATLSTLAAFNWGSLTNIGPAISSAFTSIEAQLVSAISGIPGAVAGAIAGLPGAIGGSISGAIHGAFGGGSAGAPSTPFTGQPRHPSGLGPQSPLYPGKQASNPTPVNIKTAIYLDGKVIGQSTSSAFAHAATFPTQAASADTYASWVSPDFNTAAG